MVPMSLTKEHQQLLLAVARISIQHDLQTGCLLKIILEDYPSILAEYRATFVTLELYQ
jgi:AMMECR1 domain-containing protein